MPEIADVALMSQFAINLSDRADALIAQLQKEIFNRRRKKVSPAGVVETLLESAAKSQSDKRFATSWKNLIADIETAVEVINAYGSKPSGLSDAEWALILSHRSRVGIAAGTVNTKRPARASAQAKARTVPKPKSTGKAKAVPTPKAVSTTKAASTPKAPPRSRPTPQASKPAKSIRKTAVKATAAARSAAPATPASAKAAASTARRMARAASRLSAAASLAATTSGNGAAAAAAD